MYYRVKNNNLKTFSVSILREQYTLDTIKFMSGCAFIKKKEFLGLKTSVYVAKISSHLKKNAKSFVNIRNLS